ncbi:MAG: DUF4177 domain-containing protein [Deltaproteobacteria bacterium]|nr:DUF4177 domain-containing protein [Deltaproteobacteria bacterium]
MTRYKVVECMTVADDTLESILNEWTRQGWVFDGMTFVPNEASKRPKMAFVIFTRQEEIADDSGDAT